jgi:hypothetical protein
MVEDANFLARKYREPQLIGERLEKPIDEDLRDDVEELPVAFGRGEHDAAFGQDKHGAMPLALVPTEREHKLAVEFIGVGEASRLQERRQGLPVSLVELLQHCAEPCALGDGAHGELNHPVGARHAMRLAAEPAIEI